MILLLIALLWLLFATVQDILKREVADWLSFSLIAILLSTRAAFSIINKNAFFLIEGIIFAAIFFFLGYIFYRTKVFAGGDAKLLPALATSFPSFLFSLSFFTNLLFFGAIYGIFYAIILAIKNSKQFSSEMKKMLFSTKKTRLVFLIFALFLLFFSFYEKTFFFLAIIFFVFPYIFAFVKATENSCLIKKISPKELTEGDWIVEKIKIGKKIIKQSHEGLSLSEIKILKKRKKKVLVKYGIPFVPVFLLAFVASFFGNMLVLIAKAFI